MKVDEIVIKRIIFKLLKGEDHRSEIGNIISTSLLKFAVDFFKKIISAKIDGKDIHEDWYKKYFIESGKFRKVDLAHFSGLNMKSIENIYNSTKKEIVLDASLKNYDAFLEMIEELTENGNCPEITLTLKFKKASVDLNLSESLVVINVLAVKRAAIRGGAWSAMGKAVEKPLMITLCKLFGVPNNYYQKLQNNAKNNDYREVDFYLIGSDKNEYKCEVKLMGKGNPESADSPHARFSKIFVADTLSQKGKKQLDDAGIYWVALAEKNGYHKFKDILSDIKVPYNHNIRLDDFDNDYLEKTITASMKE